MYTLVNKDSSLVQNATQLMRNSRAIYKQWSRTETRKCSFSRRVVDRWNTLPDQIVMAPSTNAFKHRLNNNWVGGPDKFNPQCLK